MSLSNYPEDSSSKEFKESILNAEQNGDVLQTDRTTTNTRKSIGYVEGYAQYTSRSGGLITNDGQSYRTEEVTQEGATESPKPLPISKQVNKQINKFRNIFGYSTSERNSDSLEDPTFLIFDLQMDYGDSPLFNSVTNFFDEYSEYMEELDERLPLYNEFLSILSKIFPGDLNEQSGSKRHYINSISGMDNLFKKIVNYPEDTLTFTLSEDVTLLSQYLSELYSNLVYSYDSHRYMIPDNLLRFNLTIFFRDVREMKSVIFNQNGEYVKDQINDNMSKFAYVLHDCQFDFFNSRSFGSDMTVSGFEGGASTTPNTLSFNINYKSYSKIMMPQLIDNSKLIDLRERDAVNDGNYNRFNNDYQSQFEHQETLDRIDDNQNYRQGGLTSSNVNAITNQEGKRKTPIADFGERLKNSFTDEISDVRNVLINKVKEEVTVLSAQAQEFVSDQIFGNVNIPGFNGITLSKVNVYYDTPEQAINRVSFLFENFLDNAVDNLRNNVRVELNPDQEGNRVNIYWDETGDTGLEKLESAARNAFYNTGGPLPRNSNVYSDKLTEGKAPTGESRHDDGQYNEKYPDGDVHIDGQYNEKYPDGDVHPDGQYNEKYPDGDVHSDGQYNLKFPDGDVHPDGVYNEKYPDGDVHSDGQYNEKYPDGDVHPDGQYNEKYPDGDVHPDGQYNEKEPLGSIQEKGTYNEKYPDGDVHPDGQYNLKFPDGDVHTDGEYNQKYPDGDVHPDGQYNEKEPKGDVYNEDDLEKGVKKPSGNVYGRIEEKEEKTPEGDVHPDGEYNEKYPKGNLYKKDDNR
jgi:hypothetical protein